MAFAGRLRAIVEHMAEMPAAAPAMLLVAPSSLRHSAGVWLTWKAAGAALERLPQPTVAMAAIARPPVPSRWRRLKMRSDIAVSIDGWVQHIRSGGRFGCMKQRINHAAIDSAPVSGHSTGLAHNHIGLSRN